MWVWTPVEDAVYYNALDYPFLIEETCSTLSPVVIFVAICYDQQNTKGI